MKPKTKKTTAKLLALLLAAVFAAGICACAKKPDSPKLTHSIVHFYSPSDGMTSFFLMRTSFPTRSAAA